MKITFRFVATFIAIVMLSFSFFAHASQGQLSQTLTSEFKADVFATQEYVVKNGDTLSALGVRTDEKYTLIAKRNNIKNPDLIFAGQVIALKRGVSEMLSIIALVEQNLAGMQQKLNTIEVGVAVVKNSLLATQAELATTKKELADKSTYLLSSTIGLFGFSALFIGYMYIQSKKNKQQHKEIFVQKRELKSLLESNSAAHHLVQVYEAEITSLKTVLSSNETKMAAMEHLLKKCDPNGDCGAPEIDPAQGKIKTPVTESSQLGKSTHHL